MCVTRVLIHNFSQPKLEVAICVCESECWFVNGVGITEEAWEWALVNKYGKVCYTNLLTQAQVLYTNFDFPTFAGENHKVLVNLTSPKSENSSDLGFSFLPSFEEGQIGDLAPPHMMCAKNARAVPEP